MASLTHGVSRRMESGGTTGKPLVGNAMKHFFYIGKTAVFSVSGWDDPRIGYAVPSPAEKVILVGIQDGSALG